MKTCIKCGYCCKQLYWYDRIKISWSTKSFIILKVCSFLKNNCCTIHYKKPEVCRSWKCGIFFKDKT